MPDAMYRHGPWRKFWPCLVLPQHVCEELQKPTQCLVTDPTCWWHLRTLPFCVHHAKMSRIDWVWKHALQRSVHPVKFLPSSC